MTEQPEKKRKAKADTRRVAVHLTEEQHRNLLARSEANLRDPNRELLIVMRECGVFDQLRTPKSE